MSASPQEQAIALWGARAVISALGMTAFTLLRLSWLRTQGQLAPEILDLYAPQTPAPQRARAGVGRAYRILWSRDCEQIGDIWLTALVYACRWLFVLSLALMIADGFSGAR